MPSVSSAEDRCWLKRDGVPQECARIHIHIHTLLSVFILCSFCSDLSSIHSCVWFCLCLRLSLCACIRFVATMSQCVRLFIQSCVGFVIILQHTHTCISILKVFVVAVAPEVKEKQKLSTYILPMLCVFVLRKRMLMLTHVYVGMHHYHTKYLNAYK